MGEPVQDQPRSFCPSCSGEALPGASAVGAAGAAHPGPERAGTSPESLLAGARWGILEQPAGGSRKPVSPKVSYQSNWKLCH